MGWQSAFKWSFCAVQHFIMFPVPQNLSAKLSHIKMSSSILHRGGHARMEVIKAPRILRDAEETAWEGFHGHFYSSHLIFCQTIKPSEFHKCETLYFSGWAKLARKTTRKRNAWKLLPWKVHKCPLHFFSKVCNNVPQCLLCIIMNYTSRWKSCVEKKHFFQW